MKKWLITGFIAIVLAALGWRLFTDLERYEKTVYRQPSRAAREDPYLAFRRWASLNGIVLEEGGPEQFAGYHAIIYDLRRYDPDAGFLYKPYWSNAEMSDLCFIVPAAGIDDETAADFLAPYLKRAGLKVGLTSGTTAVPEELPLMQDGEETATITTGQSRIFTTDRMPKGSLYIPAGTEEGRYLFVSVPVGDGRLTLTGDPLFLQNRYIGSADNADLAWRLFARSAVDDRILFMVGPGEASRSNDNPWIPWIVASWLAALLLLTWTGTRRPDSLLESPPPVGSDIGRRLAAEGEFLRRNSSTNRYVEAARLEVRRRLRRRGWSDLTDIEALDAIGRATGVEPGELQLALGEQKELPPAEYLRVMRTLHRIEESL